MGRGGDHIKAGKADRECRWWIWLVISRWTMLIIEKTYVLDSNHHVPSSAQSSSPSRQGRSSPRWVRRCNDRSCRSSACRWCRNPSRSKSCRRPAGTRTPACCPLRTPSWSRSPGSGTWWSGGGGSGWFLQYKVVRKTGNNWSASVTATSWVGGPGLAWALIIPANNISDT